MSRRGQAGFTLLEVMLSVAIITLLAGVSLPIYRSFQQRNELSTVTETVANATRRAQVYALASKQDSQWGVATQATTITLYKGMSYAARDSTADEVVSLPASVTVSGLGETNFAKQTGVPSVVGIFTLTSSTSDTKVITINAKGVVTY